MTERDLLIALAGYPRVWRVLSEQYTGTTAELLAEFRVNGVGRMPTTKLVWTNGAVNFEPTGTPGHVKVTVHDVDNAVAARLAIQGTLAWGWKLVP